MSNSSLDGLLSMVSPHLGVGRKVQEIQSEPDDARVFRYYCEAAWLEPLVGAYYPQLNGGSAHFGRTEAIASAIGEVIERYCAVFVPENVVWGTARELSDALDPGTFSLFAPEQYAEEGFGFQPFTHDARLRWTLVTSLQDGRSALAPVQLVYLLRDADPAEAKIAYPLSSGLACGPTADSATLSALLELAERDAFMSTWYNKISRPLLDWSDDPELVMLHNRHFRVPGVEFDVVDMTNDLGVPTALCAVRDSDRDVAALGVGMASAPTMAAAWKKAVLEAFQTRTWARRLRVADPSRRFAADYGDITRFQDRVHFYAYAENRHFAEFLWQSNERVRTVDVRPIEGSDPATRARRIVENFAACGVDSYLKDVTTPDVARKRLSVIRVLAPQLCPLDMSHKARYLGGLRLHRTADRDGNCYQAFNPAPHPFP